MLTDAGYTLDTTADAAELFAGLEDEPAHTPAGKAVELSREGMVEGIKSIDELRPCQSQRAAEPPTVGTA